MILVCGDRLWRGSSPVKEVLDKAKAKHGKDLVLVSGGARGADTLGYQWALRNLPREQNIKIDAEWEIHHPEWCKCRNREARDYCPMAGHRRNQQMLDLLEDARDDSNVPVRVLAFKEGFDRTLRKGGTEDMVRRAKLAMIDTYLFDGEKWQRI
jgi:hypothetical protein